MRTSFDCTAVAALAGPAAAQPPTDASKPPPAAATGDAPTDGNCEATYVSGSNQIHLLRVSSTKAKIDVYAQQSGGAFNSGFATGDATVDKNGVTYTDNGNGHCIIRLRFAPGNKLDVSQQGQDADCGFGHAVTAAGMSTKVSSARPTVGVDPRIAPATPPAGAHAAAARPPAAASSACYDDNGPVACPGDDEFVCARDDCTWRVPPGAGCDSPSNCIRHRAPGQATTAPPAASAAAGRTPRRSASFLPPPVAGEVFTVFEYRIAGQGAPTTVAVAWGAWKRQGVISPSAAGARGFVVRLRHVNPDSVSRMFTTDGSITAGPSQGAPPAAWTTPGHQQVLW